MKIVNREEFLKLPDNTLYKEYRPRSLFLGTAIKTKTLYREKDGVQVAYGWVAQLLDGAVSTQLCDVYTPFDFLENALKSGEDQPVDLTVNYQMIHTTEGEMFGIFSQDEIASYIAELQKCMQPKKPLATPVRDMLVLQDVVIATAGKATSTGLIYPLKTLEEIATIKRFKNRAVSGELVARYTDTNGRKWSESRTAEVQEAYVSHGIERVWMEDGNLLADIRVFNTPSGKILRKLLESDPEMKTVAFRMRGLRSNSELGEVEGYIFVTIDAVPVTQVI